MNTSTKSYNVYSNSFNPDKSKITKCQISGCNNEASSIFTLGYASNSEYFGYCKEHEINGKFTFVECINSEVPEIDIVCDVKCPGCGGTYSTYENELCPVIFTWHGSKCEGAEHLQNFVVCEKHYDEYAQKVGQGVYTILMEGEMAKKVIEKKGKKVKQVKSVQIKSAKSRGHSCPCAIEGPHSKISSGNEYDDSQGASFVTCTAHDHLYSNGFKLIKSKKQELKPGLTMGWPTLNVDWFNQTLSAPKIFPIDLKKAEKKAEVEKVTEDNAILYHIIYRIGPTTYHFVTYSTNEENAREKIIKRLKNNFNEGFDEEIRAIKINKVSGGVLQVYEKV